MSAGAPLLRTVTLAAIEGAARLVLWPFRLGRASRSANLEVSASIHEDTAALNEAAEKYFVEHPSTETLLRKPFSEPGLLAKRLVSVAALIDGLNLRPGQTVLELGAGTCWLSHLLNRYGCKTIAVDISPTALGIGRQLFASDTLTNWDLNPQFLPYDGHRLPLDDHSVDRVVVFDAFHHFPNPSALLRELHRVLTMDGIAGLSEPGKGHAETQHSRDEVAATGVLENELVLEDLAVAAAAAGFTSARVVIAAYPPWPQIPADQLRGFFGGKGFGHYWKDLTAALDAHHDLLLFAGETAATTRNPRQLSATIQLTQRSRLEGTAVGESAHLVFQIHNTGDTRWLSTPSAPGWTRLGIHLLNNQGTSLDFDWLRVDLPRDVEPGDRLEVRATLPAVSTAGQYVLSVDLVVEGVTWFAASGSSPLQLSWPVNG
jgi:SAM-dependent methyltransferase